MGVMRLFSEEEFGAGVCVVFGSGRACWARLVCCGWVPVHRGSRQPCCAGRRPRSSDMLCLTLAPCSAGTEAGWCPLGLIPSWNPESPPKVYCFLFFFLPAVLAANPDKLVVVMASVTWCRPCRAFQDIYEASGAGKQCWEAVLGCERHA